MAAKGKKKALFITFEGIDGCGKSTQLALLEKALQRAGYPCRILREPGGCLLAEAIRSLLLSPSETKISPEAELLLFCAARAQLWREIIKPALEQGVTVLCDRFIDSTLAYQGYGRGLDRVFIEQLNRFATASCFPDRSYLLDIEPQMSRARRNGRAEGSEDRMEASGEAFLSRVRDGYLSIAADNADRFLRLRADETEGLLHEQIVDDLRALGLKKLTADGGICSPK